MRPRGRRFVAGEGGLIELGLLICHCLLVESKDGLVLVDSGIGLEDIRSARRRYNRFLLGMARPTLDPEETAFRAIERAGLSPKDVRHVVLTHLDFDHAGGIGDFPAAEVHVLAREHAAATAPRGLIERLRYHPVQWEHSPRWKLAPDPGGDRWFGLESVRPVEGLDDVLLIPLPGHTRGHCAVAVRSDRGWLVHAGDAYFHRDEVHRSEGRRCPSGLDFFQRVLEIDKTTRLANQARLRELARGHGSEVRVFSAHDPVELEQARAAAASPTAKTAT
jgi:glyoxylase-like metal-dependent hydrolase (beta-lactamase superfamily II)